MRDRTQAGFTLVEMMIVVAILGVMTTLAIVYLRPNTKPVDVASRVGSLVDAASRSAVRLGVVRADVAASEGSKRRTRITALAGPPIVIELSELAEDPMPTWTVVERYTLPASITADGFATQVGTYVALSATLVTDWSTLDISCFPGGSCSGTTMFFSSTRGSTIDRQARVSVMPLGAATFVLNSWQ